MDSSATGAKERSDRSDDLLRRLENTHYEYSNASDVARKLQLLGLSSDKRRLSGSNESTRSIMTKDFEVYFQGLYDEARDILVQRQGQYGPSNIENLGIPGVFSRLNDDKMSRIRKALNGQVV